MNLFIAEDDSVGIVHTRVNDTDSRVEALTVFDNHGGDMLWMSAGDDPMW